MSALARLQRFAAGETAAAVYGASGGQMRDEIGQLLANGSGLTWIYDWDQAAVDEEVLLACQYAGTDQWIMVMARLHRFSERDRQHPVRWGSARAATWTAWQSTWDGRALPDEFRPFAFARINPPEEGPLS